MQILLIVGLLLFGAQVALAQQTVVGERLRIAGESQLSGNVGHPDYVSQLTRWLITPAGAADFRYLYADELRIKLFSVEEQAVYRSSLMVTPSHSETSQSFTCPAAAGTATLWVRDAATAGDARVFAANHWVVIRNFLRTDSDSDGLQELEVGDCVGQVTSYADGSGANAGEQSWTFTRGSGGSAGTITGGTVISVGAAVLDFGVPGNGAIELNAYDGPEGINAPYLQTKIWDTAPVAANFSVTSRLGKLTGITGTADEFGLIAGVYDGTPDSSTGYFRASNSAFELHGIDLSLWDGATRTFYLNRSVPSLAIGSGAPSAYGTGTGIWMGKDAGCYKFRVGDPSGNRITWDCSVLTVAGDGAGLTGIIGAGIVNGTITAADLANATITTTQIAGATILTGNIAANTIVAGNIEADTLTANEIAANAITTSELNADSVTSAKIVAGTIVASDISAGSITADRLNVTTLSAITANLGTITAGHIDGATAEFGGTVELDSSGITIDSGTGATNNLKWTDGSQITSSADTMFLNASDGIQLIGASGVSSNGSVHIINGSIYPDSTMSSGRSGDGWEEVWVEDEIMWSSPPTTTAADDPVVWSSGNEKLYVKTNAHNGTCNSNIVVQGGIIVSCDP